VCFQSCAQETNIIHQKGKDLIILENDLFSRTLKVKDSQLSTAQWISKRDDNDIIRPNSKEFSFKIDGKEVFAGERGNTFDIVDFKINRLADREQLIVTLQGKAGSIAFSLEVQIFYETYTDLAAVRKWMIIKNTGDEEITIEDLFWEHLLIDPGQGAGIDIYKDFGRSWTKPPYIGGLYDPAILVKSNDLNLIIGNEGPGMMKYTSIYRKDLEIKVGLNPSDHSYPFRKNLSKNESFKTPESFIIFSYEKNTEQAFEKDLGKYIRNYLGVKLFKREKKPFFLYNTWNPFRININEKLIKELADALENSGAEYLIIDDGWQDFSGDWNVNKEKFPNGLKPVTEYIRDKGMKPGLWISLTIVNAESEAFNKFKHFAVTDQNGEPANLHGWSNNWEILTMKIASPWYDHIKEKMRALVIDHGIEYFKIDLAMVKSAYIMDPERSGSYDQNEWFNGREEFLYTAFEKTQNLYDELSAEFPQLVIDCTFEIWGDWHIIDYGLVKHADVDWISNFEAAPPEGSRTVRNLAYHRGLTIPTSCMVIGNQKLEAENHQFSFISNFGSMPIMLGDPRKLTDDEKAWYRKMSTWFNRMDDLYSITEYYQTAGVFGPPNDNDWDGFFRFNSSKNGGIICVFRNDNADEKRYIKIPFCQENKSYEIVNGETEHALGVFQGIDLKANGFELLIEEKNKAVALEIKEVN
jgi:alpha-galactosidase